MGNVYLGCPVNVRSLLYVEKQLQNPKLSETERASLQSRYLDAKMKFDAYNSEVATVIDYNRKMKNKGIDPDTLPKIEEPKAEVVPEVNKGKKKPVTIIKEAKRLKVKTNELV